MVDRLQQNLGKYPFVTLADVKDYLSISSTTQDSRIENAIKYATGMVEHYIGQEILANDYVEIFDGGKTSVMTSRLPLSNVYLVSEYDGSNDVILNDPSSIGRPITTDGDTLTVSFNGQAHINTRVKQFGVSSVQFVAAPDNLEATTVIDELQFEDGDFTIEAYIRQDTAGIGENSIFTIYDDSTNYLQFKFAAANALSITSRRGGSSITALGGPEAGRTTSNYAPREFMHVAASYDNQAQKMRLFVNGNVAQNVAFAASNNSFTTNVVIGEGLVGYMDDLRISNSARYKTAFTPSAYRLSSDKDTISLFHFDGLNKDTTTSDTHSSASQYTFSKDVGEITKDTGNISTRGTYPVVRSSYPAMTLSGPPVFNPFPAAVRVEYRGGYETADVPSDIKMAVLDTVKLIYKQDQEKKGFSLEGERGEKYPLAASFPPHIKRILDLYRIIE
jgi:hypothetical protein